MKKIFLLILMQTAIVLTGSACISGNDGESTLPDYDFKAQPSDMLTEKEMKTLLWHARQFVGRSKQIKMHANAKKFILENDPEYRIRYYGKKRGNIRLEWKISDLSRCIVSGTGDFTEDRFPWKVELQLYREKYDGSRKKEPKKQPERGRRRGN